MRCLRNHYITLERKPTLLEPKNGDFLHPPPSCQTKVGGHIVNDVMGIPLKTCT